MARHNRRSTQVTAYWGLPNLIHLCFKSDVCCEKGPFSFENVFTFIFYSNVKESRLRVSDNTEMKAVDVWRAVDFCSFNMNLN